MLQAPFPAGCALPRRRVYTTCTYVRAPLGRSGDAGRLAVVTETEISSAEQVGPRTVEIVVSVPTVVKAVGIFFALLLAYLVRDCLLYTSPSPRDRS